MSGINKEFQRAARSARYSAKPRRASPTHKTTRDCPRVTIRLSADDHARLKDLADGAALSTYIRAKALGENLPGRKQRSPASVADKEMLAQILGLLGQSRIANNLNQLAYHANVGTLAMDETTRTQIAEAYRHVHLIRAALMMALGSRP